VVSDFGLIDAIESGLVKIPQLAIRDNAGSDIPGYFNIWEWIMQPGRLTARERGGSRASPKPEAILKWAHTPIAMLGGLWEKTLSEWQESTDEKRPPVFILVCKNTALANVIHSWLTYGTCPVGIPPSKLDGFRNTPDKSHTILVHSKVVDESDDGNSKGDENRWMRFTLDTVGRMDWPRDSMGKEILPDGFEDLAKKLERPMYPPGRDVRCIVSVAMLTEGWDCNTVTHVVGLRPFQSQLLCEQVVGRALRRASYEPDEKGLMREEVAKVFGVPFQLIPFKANPSGPPPQAPKRNHVRALRERGHLEIRFPRVEGYVQEVRNRITLEWDKVPSLTLDPLNIPAEVQMKGLNFTEQGRPSLLGPGKLDDASLKQFRAGRRIQELVFEAAASLTREYRSQNRCEIPVATLFPQLAKLVREYVERCVTVPPPADVKDLFLSPYYGWLVEILREYLRGDTATGEAPELPLIEQSRGEGSTSDVDFWTGREVREVMNSHVNYVVADTKQWEQSAAFLIDTHPRVEAFVKNAGLGFGIPYFHNGEPHDFVPDFIIRFKGSADFQLILETKGFDKLKDIKDAAAKRWCAAVNAHGGFGTWEFKMVDGPGKVVPVLAAIQSRCPVL